MATNYVKLVYQTQFSSLETANCSKSELHIHIYRCKVNTVFGGVAMLGSGWVLL